MIPREVINIFEQLFFLLLRIPNTLFRPVKTDCES